MSESYITTTKKAAIFFPSSPLNTKKLGPAIEELRNKNIIVDVDFNLDVSKGSVPYLWGSDQDRAEIFRQLLCRKDIDIIWCVRGGYGASRWLDIFDWKILDDITSYHDIIGFSDCTFFFSKLLNYGFMPIHGPLLSTFFSTSDESKDAILKLIHLGIPPYLYGKTLIRGKARGIIIGGNLTCLCHLIGTPHEPPWDGAILLIEDHHEALYRIDRMITHLLSSKRLNRLTGIVVGHILNIGLYEDLLPKLLMERLKGLSIPIAFKFPVGHHKDNFPVVLGKQYELDATQDIAILKPIS